jgi:hypothetical protein
MELKSGQMALDMKAAILKERKVVSGSMFGPMETLLKVSGVEM